MKILNTFFFSFLLLFPAYNIKSMEVSTIIALTQASAVYDAVTFTIATTAAYFGYEMAAKHFRHKNNNLLDRSIHSSNSHYGTLKGLRQALHSLRTETTNLELFKETLIKGYWIGCNSLLKSLEKQAPKYKGISNKKNSNNPKPKKDLDPKSNNVLETLPPFAEGARRLIEDEAKLETVAEEIIHRVSNLTPTSTVNNIYAALDDILEIAKIPIEWCGKSIKQCPYHHGGTINNGACTGLHFLKNLTKLIEQKLIEVHFLAEKNFHSVDKFRVINWRPIGKGFENMPYKMSTVFTGTIEEYVELIRQAVSRIKWTEEVEWALKNPNKPRDVIIKLTESLNIIFRDFNIGKSTVSSIYPALTKLGVAIGAFFWGSESEASSESITVPIEFDFPVPLLINQDQEKESEKIESESHVSQLTENISVEEFWALVAPTPVIQEEIEDALIKIPKVQPATELKSTLWEQVKYPSFLQQLQGNNQVMQDYGKYLAKQTKMDHHLTVSYRQEAFEGKDLIPAFSINEIIKMMFLACPNSPQAQEIKQYVENLTQLLIDTNPARGSRIEILENRLKMLFLDVGTDKFSDAFATTRDKLMNIYFDESQPESYFELHNEASQVIAEFIKDCISNKNAYVYMLENYARDRLYNNTVIIDAAKAVDPKSFNTENEPSIFKCYLKAIINFWTDTLNPFAYMSNSIESAREKHALYAAAVVHFKKNESTEGKTLLAHPDMPAIHKEVLTDAISQSACYAYPNFSRNLREKYGLPAAFMKDFGIESKDFTHVPKALEYLNNFSNLCRTNQENAIDSLLDLSSDSEIEEKKTIYPLFFTCNGILKNLAQKPILGSYTIPDIIGTEQATELRRYLNYVLKFKVDDYSAPIINTAIQCIIESANKLTSESEQSDHYLQMAQLIYSVELKNYPTVS